MIYAEKALVFPLAGEQLVGILAEPEMPSDCGILIVVGGPQYRAGSHRQFLLLSRRLANAGYPCLRFDYRGMGDSGGEMRDFEHISDDIAAAIDAFQKACPAVKRLILWGLCDAASATLLYLQATSDERVTGLVLLNPWVRSEASLAQTHLKHYYGQRLLQREFWAKLLSGEMQLFKSVRGFMSSLLLARRPASGSGGHEQVPFQERMASGLKEFCGNVLLILSGEDFTAKEFLEYAGSNAAWSDVLSDKKIRRVDIQEADHTFSSARQRTMVEDATIEWCRMLGEENRNVLISGKAKWKNSKR